MSQIIGSIAYGAPMPPKPSIPHRLTNAERQARMRERKKTDMQRLRDALKRIIYAKTAEEKTEIAVKVLIDE